MKTKIVRRMGVAIAARAGLVAIVAGAVGCGQAPTAERAEETAEPVAAATDGDRPAVVATTSLLCDLTRQVGEDAIDLTCLMNPGEDPHIYRPTPSDLAALEDAQLVLYSGYDFAPATIGTVRDANTDAPKVAVYEVAVPDPLLGEGHSHAHEEEGHVHEEEGHPHGEEGHVHGEEGHVHDDEGHVHDEEGHAHDEEGHAHDEEGHAHDEEGHAVGAVGEVPDPHVWHDAANGAAIAATIADRLADLDPERAEFYRENGEALVTELTAIDGWIRDRAATVPPEARRLVTTHDSFRYFAAAYGFEVKGALSGLSTAERPSAGTMTELVERVKGAAVPAIFAETTTNPKLIEAVANDAGVAVASQALFVEGPGGEGTAATTYQEMLVENTCAIVSALGGDCETDSAPLN